MSNPVQKMGVWPMAMPYDVTTILAQGEAQPHWTTTALIAGMATIALVWLLAAMLWRWLLSLMRDKVIFRVLFQFSELIFAALLSAIASYQDIFKKSTYVPSETDHPDWHTVFWAAAWSFVFALYFVVKSASITLKESDELKSKRLTADLDKERAAKASLESQRDLLVKITALARRTVIAKKARLAQLLGSKPKIKELLASLDPQKQLRLLIAVIHEFFAENLREGERLRLGIYMKDPGNPNRLSVALSWDGEREECFSGRSAEYMDLDNPKGAKSAIVRCYHSEEGFLIYPDCEAAVKAGTFSYFRPEQKETCRGMIAYKHVFDNGGKLDAMVLSVVTSQADLFREEDRDEIKQFLSEMLTRIELEWIVFELTKQFRPKPTQEEAVVS